MAISTEKNFIPSYSIEESFGRGTRSKKGTDAVGRMTDDELKFQTVAAAALKFGTWHSPIMELRDKYGAKDTHELDLSWEGKGLLWGDPRLTLSSTLSVPLYDGLVSRLNSSGLLSMEITPRLRRYCDMLKINTLNAYTNDNGDVVYCEVLLSAVSAFASQSLGWVSLKDIMESLPVVAELITDRVEEIVSVMDSAERVKESYDVSGDIRKRGTVVFREPFAVDGIDYAMLTEDYKGESILLSKDGRRIAVNGLSVEEKFDLGDRLRIETALSEGFGGGHTETSESESESGAMSAFRIGDWWPSLSDKVGVIASLSPLTVILTNDGTVHDWSEADNMGDEDGSRIITSEDIRNLKHQISQIRNEEMLGEPIRELRQGFGCGIWEAILKLSNTDRPTWLGDRSRGDTRFMSPMRDGERFELPLSANRRFSVVKVLEPIGAANESFGMGSRRKGGGDVVDDTMADAVEKGASAQYKLGDAFPREEPVGWVCSTSPLMVMSVGELYGPYEAAEEYIPLQYGKERTELNWRLPTVEELKNIAKGLGPKEFRHKLCAPATNWIWTADKKDGQPVAAALSVTSGGGFHVGLWKRNPKSDCSIVKICRPMRDLVAVD